HEMAPRQWSIGEYNPVPDNAVGVIPRRTAGASGKTKARIPIAGDPGFAWHVFLSSAISTKASDAEDVVAAPPLQAVAGSTSRMVAVALLTLFLVSLRFAQPSHGFFLCQHANRS